jgi:hypothetical protein
MGGWMEDGWIEDPKPEEIVNARSCYQRGGAVLAILENLLMTPIG